MHTPFVKDLLVVPDPAVPGDVNGRAWAVSVRDPPDSGDVVFYGWFDGTLDGNGTLDVYVQTSVDGVNWVDVAHATQVTGAGNPVHQAVAVSPALGRLVRARVHATVANFTCNVRLGGNTPFDLV